MLTANILDCMLASYSQHSGADNKAVVVMELSTIIDYSHLMFYHKLNFFSCKIIEVSKNPFAFTTLFSCLKIV